MEHLHHFQLTEDPFRCDASEKFDVALPSQDAAKARLDRAVRQGRGLALMVGGVGTAKTRIARRLYEELEEEVFEAAMMVVMRREVDADWLLTRVARQLGVQETEAEREPLIAQIYERLAIIHEDGRRAVLIIDDAQGLANAEALAEVCGLAKLEYEDRRLITVVLVGGAALDAAVAADPLLSHHVDARVALQPLVRDEAAAYLSGRVEAAGGSAEILLPGAIAALIELSEGAPGRMNTLADNALYGAWLSGRAQMVRSDVEQACRDLGWSPANTMPEQSNAVGAAVASGGAARPQTPVQADITDPLAFEESPAAATVVADLDVEPDGVFEHRSGPRVTAEPVASNTVVMDFDSISAAEAPLSPAEAPLSPAEPPAAPRPLPPMAEATQIELDEPLEAPPKDDGDEVDDLFMELLDD